MKVRIINQHYTATANARVLARLPFTVDKPWLGRKGGKSKKFRTHAAAIRWADKPTRKGSK